MRVMPRKKSKLIAINSKVLFCIKQDSIVTGVKNGYSFNHTKNIPMTSSVMFGVKSCSHKGELLIFFLYFFPEDIAISPWLTANTLVCKI